MDLKILKLFQQGHKISHLNFIFSIWKRISQLINNFPMKRPNHFSYDEKNYERNEKEIKKRKVKKNKLAAALFRGRYVIITNTILITRKLNNTITTKTTATTQ